MRPIDTLRLSAGTIARAPLRTAMLLLAVAIGVAAVAGETDRYGTDARIVFQDDEAPGLGAGERVAALDVAERFGRIRRTNAERDDPAGRALDQFARQAAEGSTGFLREFWFFLRNNKKWWLTPIIVVLLLVALFLLGLAVRRRPGRIHWVCTGGAGLALAVVESLRGRALSALAPAGAFQDGADFFAREFSVAVAVDPLENGLEARWRLLPRERLVVVPVKQAQQPGNIVLSGRPGLRLGVAGGRCRLWVRGFRRSGKLLFLHAFAIRFRFQCLVPEPLPGLCLAFQVGVKKRSGRLLDPKVMPGIALAGRVVRNRIGEGVVLGVFDFDQEFVAGWQAVERNTRPVGYGFGLAGPVEVPGAGHHQGWDLDTRP